MLSYAEEIPDTGLAPRTGWNAAGRSDHFVQFYESDKFLLQCLSDFITAGLAAGDACIVVVSGTHRAGLERRLRADGLELSLAGEDGRYVALDAADTLATFMQDGVPSPSAFAAHIGALIRAASERGVSVRVFGEMVALLWAEGNRRAAIQLEELWNTLRVDHDFSLVCAYPLLGFDADDPGPSLYEVCETHSHVIPAESYSALPSAGERLRAITRLQQKARTLDLHITERHRAAERFRFLADSIPQKVFTASPLGRIEHVNLQWRQFTGLTLVEAQQGGWSRVVHPDDAAETLGTWRSALASNESFEVEHRFRAADGSYRWHLSRARPMRDSDGTALIWIGSSTDIHDQKQREADLDRSIRLRDEFLATISHDLKTPLTVLQGQAQVLLRRLARGVLDEQVAAASLKRIEDRARMMASLVDELLDVSQLRAGQELQLCLRPIDLVALVREAIAACQETTTRHRLTLHTAEPEIVGHWDQVRLGRVVSNLLNNAVKYSPSGGDVGVDLSLEIDPQGTQAVLSVRDHGTGIAPADLAHIFEWFYRGRNAKDGIVGTGLGLAGSKQIVAQHGGTIAVESRPGMGSTFTVRLPVGS